MSINIKNPAAEKALRQLVGITGETQADAVRIAAEERLQRLQRTQRLDSAWATVHDIQVLVTETGGPLSTAALYDEHGLPR